MPGLSLDPSLLWTAKEAFRYPENISEIRDNLQKLGDWTIEAGLYHSEDGKKSYDIGALDLEQLEVDHTALFINGFPAARAHPFAGWYENEAIVFGPSDNKVRQFYSRYGVKYDSSQVSADHIMVELEFLAIMAEKYEETGDPFYYMALRDMISSYMENWVFRFLKNIEENAGTNYYRYLAAVLTTLFNQLKTELREVA